MFNFKSITTLAMALLASFFLLTEAQAGKGGGGGKAKSPTAVLNGPWGAEPGEVITFSGQGSSSPNGYITQYCFNFGDQTPIVCTASQTTTHAYTYQGNYTVTLTVTDQASQQDTTADTATIQYAVPGQMPDLVVSSVEGASRGRTGDYVPVTVTIENIDWGVATGTAQLGIYLSEDNVITTSDNKRATIYVTNLPGKSSQTYSTEILLMGNIPTGTYYYGAIADELDDIAESNETNNALTGNTIDIRPQK